MACPSSSSNPDAGNCKDCIVGGPRCGPGTFNPCTTGCCEGDVCMLGGPNSSCGTGGLACKACGSNESCVKGACRANDDGPDCGPGSKKNPCPYGCCDNDICMPGFSDAQCGQGGAACSACASNQTCTNQSCVTVSTCNATTCPTGCCNGNVCRAGTAGANCGSGGSACTACGSNQSCVNQACVNIPPDAGPACGPGSATNPCTFGCCAGSTCLSGTANSNCGTNGVACNACNTSVGEACQSGVCTAPVTASVGKACQRNSDCSSIGTGAVCKKTTATGMSTYSGGYCTKICQSNNDCPGTSSCLNFAPALDEPNPLCVADCPNPGTAPGGCRPDYACYTTTEGGSCWIDSPTPVDAGPPSDKVGNPCTTDSQCQNPPENGGFCIEDTFDGGSTGYPDGYCSADCSANPSICSSDQSALCILFETDSPGVTVDICLKVCSTPDGGQSDCRPGYVCKGYIQFYADGGQGPAPQGICLPSCQNPGSSCPPGRTCNSLGYCE